MISINWQCLSVEEFFSDSDWQGKLHKINRQPPTEEMVSFSEISTPLQVWSREFWQCLTVEQLFNNHYLKERTLTDISDPIPISLSSVSSVNQFFRCFVWEGKPKIAAIPKLEPVAQSSELSTNHLKLNDFTDLF